MVSPQWLSVLLNPSTTLPGKYGKLPCFQVFQLAALIFSAISLRLVNRFFIHHALQRALSFCNNPGNRDAIMQICARFSSRLVRTTCDAMMILALDYRALASP